MKYLITHKEQSHVWYDLAYGSTESSEVSSSSFLLLDFFHRSHESGIYFVGSLSGETRSQQIKRVCNSCSNSPGTGTTDERLSRRRKSLWKLCLQLCDGSVGGKL